MGRHERLCPAHGMPVYQSGKCAACLHEQVRMARDLTEQAHRSCSYCYPDGDANDDRAKTVHDLLVLR